MLDRRQKVILLIFLYLRRKRRQRQRQMMQQRRWWVCPINLRRMEYGAWDHLVHELRVEEPEKFMNYHRLTVHQFDSLLERITPFIQRERMIREPIPAGLKLSLTLRYLAAGDSMVSLAYAYRIGKAIVSGIISETCEAIWNILHTEVLVPPTRNRWRAIADDFESEWNFPNCTGAIDGKHIVVQNFSNSGSTFYNYKGSFSTVFMACCDANYRFVLISIGSHGRESDGGIFQTSHFGQAIVRGRLPLPDDNEIDGFPYPLPPVFVGDAAFPLLPNLMRPYGGTEVPASHVIFNYRLSRARRVVENAFGILSSRFRIFRKPIIACVSTVDEIVKATVVLHNWLRTDRPHTYTPRGYVDWEDDDGNVHPGQWRDEPAPEGLVPLPRNNARNPGHVAKETRDHFRDYFMTVGALPWQWNKLPNNSRMN